MNNGWFNRGALPGAVASLVVACGARQQPMPEVGAIPPVVPRADESSAIETADEISLASMADLLPSDARAFMLLRDPFAFVDRLGRLALIERFPERYAEVVEESKTKLGVDLTSPRGFETVGLDPHGPFGFAVLGPERNVQVLLATIRDPERLRTGGHAWADLDTETVGGSLVLTREDDAGMAMLVENGRVMVLYSEEGDARSEARQLAKRGRVDRLGVSKAFTQTMQGIELDRDGLAYANLAGEARTSSLLPDLLGIGSAFEVEGSSLRAQVRIAIGDEHPLARVARAARRSPDDGAPIVRWLDEPPGAVLHLHVDPDVLGRELADAAAGFLSFAGGGLDIDFGGEIVPAIDGSFGVALVPRDAGPPPKGHPAGEPWPRRRLVYTIFVGLRDPRPARALLERVVGRPLVGGHSLERSGKDYATADGETLIGIRDRVLLVTNDVRGFAELDPASTGRFVWPTAGATEPFLFAYDSARMWNALGLDDVPEWSEPESPFLPDDTAEIRKKVEELRVLEKELTGQTRQRIEASRRVSAAMMENMGSTWMALGPGTDGLVGHITYTVPAPTFADGVLRLADYWDQEAALSEQHELKMNALTEQIDAKRREIDELRQSH